jgi:hypothetical protein
VFTEVRSTKTKGAVRHTDTSYFFARPEDFPYEAFQAEHNHRHDDQEGQNYAEPGIALTTLVETFHAPGEPARPGVLDVKRPLENLDITVWIQYMVLQRDEPAQDRDVVVRKMQFRVRNGKWERKK